MRRILAVMLLAAVFALAGCDAEDALTIGRFAPVKSYLYESEITNAASISIYHADGFVNKTVYTQEVELIDSGGMEELKNYEQSFADLCNRDICQFQGFS